MVEIHVNEDAPNRWYVCLGPEDFVAAAGADKVRPELGNQNNIYDVFKKNIAVPKDAEKTWEMLWSNYYDQKEHICGVVMPIPIEKQVALGWAVPSSDLNALRNKLNVVVNNAVGADSLPIIAPHNFAKQPMDGDSFVVGAALLHRLIIESASKNLNSTFIPDPSMLATDGSANFLLLPISDDNLAYSDADRKALDIAGVDGSRTLFVGDVKFMKQDEFKRSGTFGLDYFVVNDHHEWPQDFVSSLKLSAANDNAIYINNHLIFEGPNVDAYASGAFYADLLKQGNDDPFYDFAKGVSIFADKYYPQFPELIKDYDRAKALDVSEMLNLMGTYLYTWKPEGVVDEAALTLSRRSVQMEIMMGISTSKNLDELKEKLDKIAETRFGGSFSDWYKSIMKEVDDSISKFHGSEDRIYFHKVGSDESTVTLIHKIAFARLNAENGFGNRILSHYSVNEKDGHMVVLLARDSDYADVDVSLVCSKGPEGVKWGGGHMDRGGFGTRLVADALSKWWTPKDGPQKVLDYVKDNVAFNDANKKEELVIDASNVRDVLSKYEFTTGATRMMDNYLLANAASEESCFLFCWDKYSSEQSQDKLLELMLKVRSKCESKSANGIIAVDTVARAIDLVQAESDNSLYSYSEAEYAIAHFERLNGTDEEEKYKYCQNGKDAISIGCISKGPNEGICYNDDGKGTLVTSVDDKHIKFEVIDPASPKN